MEGKLLNLIQTVSHTIVLVPFHDTFREYILIICACFFYSLPPRFRVAIFFLAWIGFTLRSRTTYFIHCFFLYKWIFVHRIN